MYSVYIGGNGADLNLTYYWSSTEYDYGNAWRQKFNDGSQSDKSKNLTYDVLGVRAF
jgi:hypothetical protein